MAVGWLVIPSCKDDEQGAPPTDQAGGTGGEAGVDAGGVGGDAGHPGTGGSVGGSDAANAGGAGDQAGAAGSTDSAAGAAGASDVDLAAISDACQRLCPVMNFMTETSGVCDGSSVLYHTTLYGVHDDIPASESPRCADDDDSVRACIKDTVATPCWQQAVYFDNCMAEGVWSCDGGTWGESECPGVEPACSP